eukprot:Phypoly_transcript_09989.p1 GENE.Phypoly_transcript_09989~~Phypoly_transcript_09989.p1  ORF type:complete len:205 (+),score=18.21 Phypoly_transcript_09989:47-661(+)
MNKTLLAAFVALLVVLQHGQAHEMLVGRVLTPEEIKAMKPQVDASRKNLPPYPIHSIPSKPPKKKTSCPYIDSVLCKVGKGVLDMYTEMSFLNINQTFEFVITYETIAESQKMKQTAIQMNKEVMFSGLDWLVAYRDKVFKEWKESRAGQEGWEDVVFQSTWSALCPGQIVVTAPRKSIHTIAADPAVVGLWCCEDYFPPVWDD